MSVLAIELNDAGIRAARADADALLAVDGEHRASPGFAATGPRSLVTGMAAAQQAGLHPIDLYDRFWDQLDTEPIDPRDPRAPNRAEVAFAHLEQIVQAVLQPDDTVVVAVPPGYDRRQLGILAGIARELKLPLAALVASPIAIDVEPHADQGGPDGAVLVVDLFLHRCAMSIVETGPEIVLGPTRLCPDVGLRALRNQWLKSIGGEFVRTIRFDPLHDATTERQLHERLPALLDALAKNGSDEVTLESGSHVQRATVTEALLADAGHGLVFRLCRDIQAATGSRKLSAILLNDDASSVPGLRHALARQAGVPVRALSPGAAALGLARTWPDRFDRSPAPGVAYYCRRAATGAPAPGPAGVGTAATDEPTG